MPKKSSPSGQPSETIRSDVERLIMDSPHPRIAASQLVSAVVRAVSRTRIAPEAGIEFYAATTMLREAAYRLAWMDEQEASLRLRGEPLSPTVGAPPRAILRTLEGIETDGDVRAAFLEALDAVAREDPYSDCERLVQMLKALGNRQCQDDSLNAAIDASIAAWRGALQGSNAPKWRIINDALRLAGLECLSPDALSQVWTDRKKPQRSPG